MIARAIVLSRDHNPTHHLFENWSMAMNRIRKIFTMYRDRLLSRLCLAYVTIAAAPFAMQVQAQTCPFDDGNSSIEVEGLILTRYALGLTGAPLVAHTNINAVDAPRVEATINCPSCGLNITGNPAMTVADATIISRKLAGFSGAALIDNVALGSGTRNTPAAVQSFLLSGCGATGGTITSITAGSGLTGGTITTSGTIAADTTFLQRRLSSTCSAGSFITGVAADGTVTCGAPTASAGGTVTNIATGNGILGGPITATGTLSADTAFLQRRVATPCAAGSFITAIAVDGTPTCATPPPGAGGTVTSVGTGQGLAGGPISTTGTIDLTANQLMPTAACAATQIAKWSGSAWACAADDAGPANAFVQGGNAFGAPAVIGTTDAQPVTVQSGGSAVNLLTARGDGLRIAGRVSGASSPSTINGNRLNSTLPGVLGATIAGGGSEGIVNEPNTVSGNFGTVGGGSANTAGNNGTVAGGIVNVASGSGSSVAGGNNNTASGSSSFVAGGAGNTASGDYSFAAGRRASADRDGAFVWADSRLFGFSSSATWPGTGGVNSFSARATGGVTFVTAITGSGATLNECYLNGGSNVGTGWNCTSDRNAKERVTPISPKRVLEQLVAMPVSTWSIIGSSLRQMGPMAQDFYQAFGLGDTDRAINSVNANGVAFAAIQGLNQKLTAQGTVIRAKKVEIAKLKANAATLAARLAAIEKKLGL